MRRWPACAQPTRFIRSSWPLDCRVGAAVSVPARDAFPARVGGANDQAVADETGVEPAVEIARDDAMAFGLEGGPERLGLGAGFEFGHAVQVHDMAEIECGLRLQAPVQDRN